MWDVLYPLESGGGAVAGEGIVVTFAVEAPGALGGDGGLKDGAVSAPGVSPVGAGFGANISEPILGAVAAPPSLGTGAEVEFEDLLILDE
jgi:hypothetical protein